MLPLFSLRMNSINGIVTAKCTRRNATMCMHAVLGIGLAFHFLSTQRGSAIAYHPDYF